MTKSNTNSKTAPGGQDPAPDRRAQRIADTGKPVVIQPAGRGAVHGQSIDEAYGGIGVLVAQQPNLVAGQEADVLYNGKRMTAVVRHVHPSGYDGHRIGLAWKGTVLSQRARAALKLRRKQGRVGSNKAFEMLVRSVPGGVQMMWSLYESENYVELGEATERIAKQGRAAGIGGLTPLAEEVTSVIAEQASYQEIGGALDELINGCIAIVEGSAD